MDVEYKKPVVVLIHGIRDHALWQQEIRDTLEAAGFKVISTNYGRFDLFRFLMPFGYFREKAIAEILNQIKSVFFSNSDSSVSVIAHSFGTYVFGHIIRNNFDLKFHRVIFCGSVLKYNFPFEQIQDRFLPDILNEVGTRDIWPAIAESVTFGYGSAGTFGFRRPLVYDRWHNGAEHGYFLTTEFCSKHWVPFLKEGNLVPDSAKPESPPMLARLVNLFPIKYLIFLTFVAVGYILFSGKITQYFATPQSEVTCGVTEAELALFKADIERAYKSTGWQLAWFDSWMRPPALSTLRVDGDVITVTASDGREVSMSLDPNGLPSPQYYGKPGSDLQKMSAACAVSISNFFAKYQVYKNALTNVTSRPSDLRGALIGMHVVSREAVYSGREALCTLGKVPPALVPDVGIPEPVPANCSFALP